MVQRIAVVDNVLTQGELQAPEIVKVYKVIAKVILVVCF
jgi:hypothetical protein